MGRAVAVPGWDTFPLLGQWYSPLLTSDTTPSNRRGRWPGGDRLLGRCDAILRVEGPAPEADTLVRQRPRPRTEGLRQSGRRGGGGLAGIHTNISKIRSSAPSHHIVETPRLRLRPPQPADAQAIFERYASDPRVTRYLGWPTHRTVGDTEDFLGILRLGMGALAGWSLPDRIPR